MISSQPFPIDLVFPPQGHFTQPYLALPCLKAWLVAHGYDDIVLRDLSIEAYDRFLEPDWIERCAERVRSRMPLERFESREQLSFAEMDAFRAAAETAVSWREVARRVPGAKETVRSEAFYDPDRYLPAMRTLYHGLRIVSAAHFPSRLTPHNFTTGYANDRSREVLAATRDEDQNPFLAFYREEVLPQLVERRPRLLGMSVIYGSQLVPALTLGRLVKQALPDCHVTAGGGFLAYIGEKLMRAEGIDACLDSVVFHEGEAPLLALAGALAEGRSLAEVGSLTWYERSTGGARPVANPPAHPIRLDDAPAPDFRGLPFERYFSPKLVLPYDVNRGCYWGECTFCTLPTVIGPGYRTRSAATIVEHVLELRERHGTDCFNFVTDCMPPGMIHDLPEELIRRKADIRWWADARVEPKAYTEKGAQRLYESGCRKLLFGFESATPRLLKLMKKGQSPRTTLEVARNCARAGISVTFYAMVGFPSETREEARATLRFLMDARDVVREVSLQTFHIDEVAQTYREPKRFGIEILSDPEADLALYHDYVAQEGMTQEEAAELFEEMMAGLREALPIFSGDNMLYFMQKSHYFLHLARGTTPDEFVRACREREQRRREAAADPRLAPRSSLAFVDLPFGYVEVVRTLGSPLARIVRPAFLTGRFDPAAQRRAEQRLAPVPRRASVLAYDGEAAEFCELTPDGRRALEALARAGSLGALLASLDPALPAGEAARANLERFARDLARTGLLCPA